MNTSDTLTGTLSLEEFRQEHGDPATWIPGEFDAWLERCDTHLAQQPQPQSVTR